jgi:NIPSNAP
VIHELRIYRCAPGRLAALNKRFETTTLKMFEKHGVKQVGFWTVAIGATNHDLYYILEWESLAQRDQVWSAFMSDPEWIAARAASEKDGPIVAGITNYILQPTSYSKIR